MKFTSAIVRTQNQLVKIGYNRSDATKIAFLRAQSEYKAFCQILANGWQVRVKYAADKYAGEVQKRLAGSVSAAIEAGLCEVLGTGPQYDHLFTYYDCDRQGIRKFKKANFMGFEIV
jgi:hypothetical protein